MTNENVDINKLGGAIDWDEAGGGSYVKALQGLLGIGDGDDLFGRGRLTEQEQKASLVLMSRAMRTHQRKLKRKKGKPKGNPWWDMSEGERAVRLNLALSISRDGEGRSETVSSLIGQMVRSAKSVGRRIRRNTQNSMAE